MTQIQLYPWLISAVAELAFPSVLTINVDLNLKLFWAFFVPNGTIFGEV